VVVHTKSVIQVFQQGSLKAGQYSFPFAVELPNGLPSSFVYSHGSPDFSKLRIKYKLRAAMLDLNEGPTRLNPMIAKKMLVVSHVPANPR
jgi:hypothetical protein